MAKTVYVRIGGNDGNDGLTVGAPKLTLAGANAVLVSTDTCDIGPGTWTEEDQLGLVSNCTYKGAGMYLTTIVGNIPYTTGVTISKIKMLKCTLTSYATGAKLPLYWVWDRVLLDGSGYTTGNNQMWQIGYAYESKFTNCIFHKLITSTTALIVITNLLPSPKFFNCIFYKTGSSHCLFYDNSKGNFNFQMRNCILHTKTCNYWWDGINPSTTVVANIKHSNNIFYGYPTGRPALTSTEYTTDPLFVAPETFDFHLGTGSPAIGTGTTNLV